MSIVDKMLSLLFFIQYVLFSLKIYNCFKSSQLLMTIYNKLYYGSRDNALFLSVAAILDHLHTDAKGSLNLVSGGFSKP